MIRTLLCSMTIGIWSEEREGTDLHELAGIQTLIMRSMFISHRCPDTNSRVDLLRYDKYSALCDGTARYTEVELAGLAC